MTTVQYEPIASEEQFWAMCEAEHQEDPNYMRDDFEKAERAALESEWAADEANGILAGHRATLDHAQANRDRLEHELLAAKANVARALIALKGYKP